MSTSQKTYSPLDPDFANRDFSEGELVYLEQRALNNVYDFVLRKFLEEQSDSGLTKAELARRVNRGQAQVNRWLASPGNWTIGTIQRLMAAISGEEIFLESRSFANRKPQNMTMVDLLDVDQAIVDGARKFPAETVSSTNQYEIAIEIKGSPRRLEDA